MESDTIRRRGGLRRTARRLREGGLTVGFLDGSITDARPGYNWPEPVLAWLQGAFPGVRLAIENAAIGTVGSDLAAFRARRDILETVKNRGSYVATRRQL